MWPSIAKPTILRWDSIWDTSRTSRLWLLSILTFCHGSIEESLLYTNICFVASRMLHLPSYGSKKSTVYLHWPSMIRSCCHICGWASVAAACKNVPRNFFHRLCTNDLWKCLSSHPFPSKRWLLLSFKHLGSQLAHWLGGWGHVLGINGEYTDFHVQRTW